MQSKPITSIITPRSIKRHPHLIRAIMGTTGGRRPRKRGVHDHAATSAPASTFDAVDDPNDPYFFPVDEPRSPPKPATQHTSTSPDKRPRIPAKQPNAGATTQRQPASTRPPKPNTKPAAARLSHPSPAASPPQPVPIRSPTRPVQLPPPAVRTAKPAPPSQGGLLNPAAARTLFRSSSGGAALAVEPPPAATTISEVRLLP